MFLRGSTRKEFVRWFTFVVNDRLRGFAKCKRECYRWNTNDWTDEKVIFLTREKEKLVHVGDCLLLMGVLYLRCSACVIKNKIGLTDCCTTDRQQLFFAAYIVGFHMTSLKIKLKNYRSYRDLYFHDALEQLKTNFHANFRFKRVLGFLIARVLLNF